MKSGFSLKDQLFNSDKISYLGKQIKNCYSRFNQQGFYADTIKKFPTLELKERITHITHMLRHYLPEDYQKAVTILLQALPPALAPHKKDDDFGDFIFAPFGEYVALYGVSQPALLTFSLHALKTITKRFSVEIPIRSYLNTYPKETLASMAKWSNDPNYHVRRLSSEGTRPRLPWAPKVHLDYNLVIDKILGNLYYDPTRYVIRSVANHLNDIAKTEPALVINTLKKWKTLTKPSFKPSLKGNKLQDEFDYLSRHALRTLIKQGHKPTMNFLGYKMPKVGIKNFRLSPVVLKLNELTGEGKYLEFEITILSQGSTSQKLIVDYRIFFTGKKSSSAPREKVFKLTTLTIGKEENHTIKKKHLLRSDMTTFKLYPGKHSLELQVNGVSMGEASFTIQK